jgi:hypothetical protein
MTYRQLTAQVHIFLRELSFKYQIDAGTNIANMPQGFG